MLRTRVVYTITQAGTPAVFHLVCICVQIFKYNQFADRKSSWGVSTTFLVITVVVRLPYEADWLSKITCNQCSLSHPRVFRGGWVIRLFKSLQQPWKHHSTLPFIHDINRTDAKYIYRVCTFSSNNFMVNTFLLKNHRVWLSSLCTFLQKCQAIGRIKGQKRNKTPILEPQKPWWEH